MSSAWALRHWLAARDDAAAEETLAARDALEPEQLAIVPAEERLGR